VKRSEIVEGCTSLESNPKFKAIVEWVSHADHIGKIRLNAHGDAGGIISMGTDRIGSGLRQSHAIEANLFAMFLVVNELVNPWLKSYERSKGYAKGLTTIALALCHAAEDTDQTKKDPTSAIKKVTTTLTDYGFTDIEVTGSVSSVAI